MPEPIMKHDGTEKNDCERNAAKRFIAKLRQDHPHLKFIVTEDGLSSNAPHIETLHPTLSRCKLRKNHLPSADYVATGRSTLQGRFSDGKGPC
jgi:hypothetical protein